MLRYNNQSPFHCSPYNLESYEPINLTPEEKQQNNSFIEMAFANKIANKNKINYSNIQNIQDISNYNTQDSINKIKIYDTPLNNNKIYGKSKINNLYKFNNLINKNPNKFFSPIKINLMPNNTILSPIRGYQEVNENSFLGKKKNIPHCNYPYIPRQINRCNSSQFLSYMNQPNIINKNDNINSNKIILPIKITQLSPLNAHKTNIVSNKNAIPIYRKIIFRRKKNIF